MAQIIRVAGFEAQKPGCVSAKQPKSFFLNLKAEPDGWAWVSMWQASVSTQSFLYINVSELEEIPHIDKSSSRTQP